MPTFLKVFSERQYYRVTNRASAFCSQRRKNLPCRLFHSPQSTGFLYEKHILFSKLSLHPEQFRLVINRKPFIHASSLLIKYSMDCTSFSEDQTAQRLCRKQNCSSECIPCLLLSPARNLEASPKERISKGNSIQITLPYFFYISPRTFWLVSTFALAPFL